jgi:hypothetical protein
MDEEPPESLVDTTKDLHEELGFMIQVEAKTTKTLIEITRSKFQSVGRS